MSILRDRDTKCKQLSGFTETEVFEEMTEGALGENLVVASNTVDGFGLTSATSDVRINAGPLGDVEFHNLFGTCWVNSNS